MPTFTIADDFTSIPQMDHVSFSLDNEENEDWLKMSDDTFDGLSGAIQVVSESRGRFLASCNGVPFLAESHGITVGPTPAILDTARTWRSTQASPGQLFTRQQLVHLVAAFESHAKRWASLREPIEIQYERLLEDWVQGKGPRGGTYWEKDGKKVYQKEKPSSRRGEKRAKPDSATRKQRTEDELKQGLSGWVDAYKESRKHGAVKQAKKLKAGIDSVIRDKDLDAEMVFGAAPEDPNIRPDPANKQAGSQGTGAIKTPDAPLPAGKYDAGDPRNDPAYEAYTTQVEGKIKEHQQAGRDTETMYAKKGNDGKPLKDEDGDVIYNAERVSQQDALLDSLVEKVRDIPNERQCWLVGGLSGSGKSTFLAKRGDEMGLEMGKDEKGHPIPLNAAVLNPDDIKEAMQEAGMVPEYEGLKPGETAALIHEESSTLTKAFQERLLAEGKNVCLDLTVSGKTDKFTGKYVKKLKEAGYGPLTAAFVDGDMKTSLYRAGKRHQRPDDDGNASMNGRYVPYDVLLWQGPPDGSPYKSQNRELFEDLKGRGSFGNTMIMDNLTGEITREKAKGRA